MYCSQHWTDSLVCRSPIDSANVLKLSRFTSLCRPDMTYTIDRVLKASLPISLLCLSQVKLRQQLQSVENDLALDNIEKARRKEALILQHSMGAGGLLGVGSRPLYSPVSQPPPLALGLSMSTMSPHAPAFYPPGNTVESVVG